RCRGIKSLHEVELMRLANRITLKSYEMALQSLKEGMTHLELATKIAEAHRQLGAEHGFALVLFAKNAALPHGTMAPQKLREGDIILIDGGCSIEGYESDVSRTAIFGKNTGNQNCGWDNGKRGHTAACSPVRAGAAL